MSGLKENLQVQTEGAILAAEQAGFSFVNNFKLMPQGKRILALGLLIALIPGYLLARFGTEQLQRLQYGRQALVAHPAFSAAVAPKASSVNIIRNPNGSFSAYAIITNPNLDLAAENINYSISFQSSGRSEVYKATGSFYLLPNEKRYIVVPKIDTTDYLTGGTLTLGEVQWQKKLSIPEVSLKVSEPLTYEETNPLTFYAEGAVVNNSPYDLSAVRLVFLLLDSNNKVVGISQRDEFRIPAFGRRAYKQLWPGLYKSDVNKVQVIATTNTLDEENVRIEGTGAPTTPDDRESQSNEFF